MSIYLLVSIVLSIGGFTVEYFMATWAIIEKSTYLGGAVAFIGFAVWNLGAFRAASVQESRLHCRYGSLSYFINGTRLDYGIEKSFYILDMVSR